MLGFDWEGEKDTEYFSSLNTFLVPLFWGKIFFLSFTGLVF